MKSILFVIGTRPEAIKLAPVILYFKTQIQTFEVRVCITAQHRLLLDEVLDFFSIVPDFDLNLMKGNQRLNGLTAAILTNLEHVLAEVDPRLLVVQGDTTTAMAGALSAFYNNIPVCHIEAGLRSFNKQQPFPEEVNRRIISQIAEYHFCPTKKALNNLEIEHVDGLKYVVGNTVIDALLLAKKIISNSAKKYQEKFSFITKGKRYILVTIHRRENFGLPAIEICRALTKILEKNSNVELIIPVHPNPNIKHNVESAFLNHKQVHLLSPLRYDDLIYVMEASYFVITDSGGIQEEAPSLGKPVLILRNVTERTEGIEEGTAILIGNSYDQIVFRVDEILNSEDIFSKMANRVNPYGDGRSSSKIYEILQLHEN